MIISDSSVAYEDLVILYVRKIGRRETVFAIPLIPNWAARAWITQFMPKKHAGVAGPMVVTDDSALQLFPAIHPQPIELAFLGT